MTPTQKFLEALENWQEANREYHDRKARYDGCSPDYALYPERERMRDATTELQMAFEDAVAQAVQKALGSRAEDH